jgi:hypothetical protein
MASNELIDISDTPKNQDGTRSVLSLWHRPGHWTIFGYRFVPLLLFAVGTCGVIYGAMYHGIPVIETKVEKYTVQVPDKSAPPAIPPEMPVFGPPGMPPGFGTDDPYLPPPPKMKDEVRTREVPSPAEKSELEFNDKVTVDGVQWTKDGQLAWTGTGDGGGSGGGGSKGPAACPT